MKRIFAIFAAAIIALPAMADEGMWLLPLLEKMNGKSLAEAGCRLTPEQIYSINNGSLKDAIVHFGGGCTGEIISNRGLIVTNHHCGYSSIQRLSTPDHNYLMDGYWAMTDKDELPVERLTVTFLKKMTDVTDAVADAVAKAGKEGVDAEQATKAFIEATEKAAAEANPGCDANVVSFYNGNVYYLIIDKEYTDVRFVGAPPASVGKFGGETDNWMWPRHTGDFSMFRVYAGPDNEPAAYSPDNRPYIPEGHLKVSLEGVQEGDYAMIMGYPGRTQRFQTAAQLRNMIAVNRIRIDARTVRQDIMWEAMCADPAVQLKYANKYASSANGWKKWQGEELAFGKLGIIEREEKKEADFMEWVGQDKKRVEAYGSALKTIEDGVEASSEAVKAFTLIYEAPVRIELLSLASVYDRSLGRVPEGKDTLEFALSSLEPLYKDYVEALDRKEAAALLKYYRDKADKKNYPDSLGAGFEDFATMDIDAYVVYLFDGSVFTSPEKVRAAGGKDLSADPAAVLYKKLRGIMMPLYTQAYGKQEALAEGTKAFGAGLMEWQKGKPSYPDANSTMRLTYGPVLPYSPKDGVLFSHFTTLKGVMEKEDASNPEFIVPAGLKKLYEAGDYGRYADKDGSLHTCFLTNNDITGGNSGSPVLDADGALIGLAFDGNWESMSSDVMFEPDLQRCICVDIRYVLFLVEKLGGCPRIVDELEFKTAPKASKPGKAPKAAKKSKKK